MLDMENVRYGKCVNYSRPQSPSFYNAITKSVKYQIKLNIFLDMITDGVIVDDFSFFTTFHHKKFSTAHGSLHRGGNIRVTFHLKMRCEHLTKIKEVMARSYRVRKN